MSSRPQTQRTSVLRELAKFACGAEAFHAFIHAVLWLSGTTVTVLGVTATPAWNILGVVGNAVVAVLLGTYGWRRRSPAPDTTPVREEL